MLPEVIGVLNSGSASIKFALFEVDGNELCPSIKGQIEGIYTCPHFLATSNDQFRHEQFWGVGETLTHAEATEYVLTFLRQWLSGARLIGVGHRVVHGGTTFKCPVRVDAQVMCALEKLIPLAPLHQPYNLEPISLALERLPNLPQVACFDTEFHCTIPEIAQMFALPAEFHQAGVRRYGFHGLSYEYVASGLASLDSQAAAGKSVVLHLGNGASMCAIRNGQSVATTMGFTALDGLPMGTRCGSIDAGVILHLMDAHGMDARAIEKLLYNQSGLLGVSRISSDMRTLLTSGEPRAKLAVDLFIYRICRELGSLAAALNGLESIVFTGGIGEKSAIVRERVCRSSAWLGVQLDDIANAEGGPRISTDRSSVSAWVVPTNEELMIAQHTKRIVCEQVSVP